MTVAELIEKLKEQPPQREVVIQADDKGRFSLDEIVSHEEEDQTFCSLNWIE